MCLALRGERPHDEVCHCLDSLQGHRGHENAVPELGKKWFTELVEQHAMLRQDCMGDYHGDNGPEEQWSRVVYGGYGNVRVQNWEVGVEEDGEAR